MSETLRERCFYDLLRVNRIIHLDTMTADDVDTDVLEFLVDNGDVLAAAFGWDVDEADDGDEEDLEDALRAIAATGWLIEAATPERKNRPGYSWGVTTFRVFYGASYNEALEKAFTWVDAMGQDRHATPQAVGG